MLPRTTLTIFALFVLVSCVSKKYGRYFNNQLDYSTTTTNNQPINQPELFSSADEHLTLTKTTISQPKKDLPASIGQSSKVWRSPSKESSDKSHVQLKKRALRKTKKKKDTKTSDRKTEPLGLASFGLFFLTLFLFALGGAVGISSGFVAVLIMASMVLGGISVYKIKGNKKKWKGRFFGTFVVVSGLLFLFLLGLSAFIGAAFGNT